MEEHCADSDRGRVKVPQVFSASKKQNKKQLSLALSYFQAYNVTYTSMLVLTTFLSAS